MNKFKAGDKVMAKVEDEYTSKGKITEVLFVPGDKEYDDMNCCYAAKGFMHKPYPNKEYDDMNFYQAAMGFMHKPYPNKGYGGELKKVPWTWNFQRDFTLVKD